MREFVLFAVLLAFLIAPAAAVADDLLPPWWRGQDRTTSQIWEFLNDAREDVIPDGPAPGGLDPLTSTMLDITPGEGMGWLEWNHERPGVWQLSGRIDVIVDNFDPPNDEKRIWVQITWRPQEEGSGAKPIFDYVFPAPSPDHPVTLVEEIDLENGWVHSTYAWRLDWNPPDETFGFRGDIEGINIDELVVDTWCIPEPGTIAGLMGLGLAVGLIYWRRRK